MLKNKCFAKRFVFGSAPASRNVLLLRAGSPFHGENIQGNRLGGTDLAIPLALSYSRGSWHVLGDSFRQNSESGQWSEKDRTNSPDNPPENALRRPGDNDQLLVGEKKKKENVADLVSRFVVSLRVQSNRE
jgi:hypothetical protein